MEDNVDDVAVERVVKAEDVRLYRGTAVLGYLNGPVWNLNQTRFTWDWTGAVPVTDHLGNRLGFASLWIEPDGDPRLMAQIAIDYSSEARLLAEQNELYAYPLATPLGIQQALDFHAQVTPVHITITGVMLLQRAPNDFRIQPFGEGDVE